MNPVRVDPIESFPVEGSTTEVRATTSQEAHTTGPAMRETASSLRVISPTTDPTQTAPAKRQRGRARVICAADVQPEMIRWLWPGYLPLGKLAAVDGDPGLAKSTFLLDIGARVSVGGVLPDGTKLDGPRSVIVLSAEDGVADTIIPRLMAAGADLSRVHLLTGVELGNGESRPLELPGDTATLRETIIKHNAALVIIDPLMAYLSPNIDSHRDQDVRRALSQLKIVAEETGAAIVIVRHCTKGIGTSAIHKGGGSVGIIGAVRVGMLVAKEPEAPEGGRCILAVTKSNIGPIPPALVYRSVTDEAHGCGRIQWEGTTKHIADDLAAGPVNSEERGALAEAGEFLLEFLQDGPKGATEVFDAGKEAGISPRTLKRAKEPHKVRTYRDGKRWVWAAPIVPADARSEAASVEGSQECQGGQEFQGEMFGPLGTLDRHAGRSDPEPTG